MEAVEKQHTALTKVWEHLHYLQEQLASRSW